MLFLIIFKLFLFHCKEDKLHFFRNILNSENATYNTLKMTS